ncbi:MAG: hypothetical protein IJG84_11150 [Kiritimatiellae bacterium]|nr:hypothetical protein [Kiritimatiellia bacterium]
MGNLKKKKRPEWTCIAEREFDGDIVITDPCYIRENGKRIDWGSHEAMMKDVGLCNRTYYGDWGCTVFAAMGPVGHSYDKSAKIGEFCADAGMVCVLDMRDARRMCPDIDKWIAEHYWCATVISGFKGKVRLMTMTTKRWMKDLKDPKKRIVYDDVELRVRGDGMKDGDTFCFESYQTSL